MTSSANAASRFHELAFTQLSRTLQKLFLKLVRGCECLVPTLHSYAEILTPKDSLGMRPKCLAPEAGAFREIRPIPPCGPEGVGCEAGNRPPPDTDQGRTTILGLQPSKLRNKSVIFCYNGWNSLRLLMHLGVFYIMISVLVSITDKFFPDLNEPKGQVFQIWVHLMGSWYGGEAACQVTWVVEKVRFPPSVCRAKMGQDGPGHLSRAHPVLHFPTLGSTPSIEIS